MLENAIKRASDEMGEAFDILLQKSIDEGMLKN
jgi:putative hydrolase of HD superfamily